MHNFSIMRWCRRLDGGGPGEQQQDLECSGIITVDAKSLYDAVSYFGTNKPACKRTCFEVAVIEQVISRAGHVLKWVPTAEMLADTLTKIGNQGDRLYEILAGGMYTLVDRGQAGVSSFIGWLLSDI